MNGIQLVSINKLKTNPRNARTHSKKQIRQIADSIAAYGFTVPVLIDENAMLIAGHGRLEAAKLLGLSQVPAIVLDGLSEAKKRALLLADNKIAENAGWDRERVAIELPELTEILVEEGLSIAITGFEAVEIDQIVSDFEENTSDAADKWKAPGYPPTLSAGQETSGNSATTGCYAGIRGGRAPSIS